MRKTVVLVVMDGVGETPEELGNMVLRANTPTLDALKANSPWCCIKAHGGAVGLPSDDDMGNSEVGHNALGCGQIYSQGAKLVNESIESGDVFRSETWKNIVNSVAAGDKTLHFIGLLSDGNVHSNIHHLLAMLAEAKKEGVRRVRVHVLLDGRDVPATSALEYVTLLEETLSKLNDDNFDGRIASGGGRMKITMDRYQANWPMVKAGWDVHVHGEGRRFSNCTEAIETLRSETGAIDQDLSAFVIAEDGKAVGAMEDGDGVILYNFRGDRALELSMAFDGDGTFDKFDRGFVPKVKYAGMLQYDGDLKIPKNYLVNPPQIRETLTELLVQNGIREYAVSETQKYGHVTYFWNGNRSEKFSEELEDYCEIPSDVRSFDECPWMKATEIADKVIEAIESGRYGFIRCNFPNGDMVGHTGNLDATEIAVESVDLELARIKKACDAAGCILVVTADHGNSDQMLEKNKKGAVEVRTAHSLNPVPFIIYDGEIRHELRDGNFGLANVAPTVADLMGIKPFDSWEESMLRWNSKDFRKVFDTIPDQFDKFRPRYSAELFDDLISYAQIGPGKDVLELGPGTGQATEPILATGCNYSAIELGENLFEKMREKFGHYPNFSIVNDDFITHDFGDRKFDMIYSAATIQWIPEEIAFSKTFELLKPGGTLAMMLTWADYKSPNEELYEKIQKLYEIYYKPETPYTHGKFGYTNAPAYGFTEVERRLFAGERVMNADEYVAFSGTHCDHIVIPEPYKTRFFEELHKAVTEADNRIVFKDTYVLYLTKKPLA